MSRLIIKNLPAYLTSDRLRKHFEQKGAPSGTITDVKISLKQDGTSRRFGFVGFKSDQEATAARDWFDRTFIDSTRINVMIVEVTFFSWLRHLSDPTADPGPSSRPLVHRTEKSNKTSTPAPSTSASSLDQLMDVMQPHTKKGPLWANEVKESHPVLSPTDPPETNTIPEDLDDNEAISDLEWMRHRMKSASDVSPDKVFEQSDDEHGDVNHSAVLDEPKDPAKDTIMQTSRLFLRNLALSCTEHELTEQFRPFGEVTQVHIPVDSVSKQPTFALSAYEALDKKSFQGRLLHIVVMCKYEGF